jgi:hypothetical protein
VGRDGGLTPPTTTTTRLCTIPADRPRR